MFNHHFINYYYLNININITRASNTWFLKIWTIVNKKSKLWNPRNIRTQLRSDMIASRCWIESLDLRIRTIVNKKNYRTSPVTFTVSNQRDLRDFTINNKDFWGDHNTLVEQCIAKKLRNVCSTQTFELFFDIAV